MPSRDGFGPMGAGAMTGRGLGFCRGGIGRGVAAAAASAVGWGMMRGFKRGFGGNRGFASDNIPNDQTEISVLKEQLLILQEKIDLLQKKSED